MDTWHQRNNLASDPYALINAPWSIRSDLDDKNVEVIVLSMSLAFNCVNSVKVKAVSEIVVHAYLITIAYNNVI